MSAQPAGRSARNVAARWSLIGSIAILLLKFAAFLLTGSIGFLSDAAESLVNLVAAVVLLVALGISATPPDYRHPYGHTKAEYLSSGLEAALILLAAAAIVVTAVQRLLHPQPLTHVTAGIVVSGAAAVVNGALALYLFRVGKRQRSMALETNARHILTDVWTSVGVIVGVTLVGITGWDPIDPIIALFVAANIVVAGLSVMRRSVSNLLDERLPESEEAFILEVLASTPEIRGFHRLRTRRSGRARFAEVDVFVAPKMTVAEAHALVARVEDRIHERLDDLVTTVHVEPFVEGVRDVSRTPHDEFGER